MFWQNWALYKLKSTKGYSTDYAVIAYCGYFVLLYNQMIGFVDPYLDRKGLSGADSFRIMLKNFFTIMFFSLIGGLLLLIPIFGWLLGPTYSVVAGIIIAIGIQSENQVVFKLKDS